MVERSQKETTQFPLSTIDTLETVLFVEAREETLGGLSRILRAITQTPQVGVERIPVDLAERIKRFRRPGRRCLAGEQHDIPMGRGKWFATRGSRVVFPIGG